MSFYNRLMNNLDSYYKERVSSPMEELTDENAYKFIEDYFKAGRKGEALNLNFKKELCQDGKHIHSVVLYYLGCELSEVINDNLRDYLNKYINNIDWYNFKYTWFLTCLYHDTASVVEKSMYKDEELEFFLEDNKVETNVFEYITKIKKPSLVTFPEEVVKNYFTYKIKTPLEEERHGQVDHGILGGYILFDKLLKNYNDAYKEYQRKVIENNRYSYDEFEYKGVMWRKEHLTHFAIIADSIIAHNIWFNGDEHLYKEYGLEKLLIKSGERIKVRQRPLYFFLTLLDTIEPTKRFTTLTAKQTLESIDVSYADKKLHINIIDNKLSACEECDGWKRGIKGLETWLDVEVDIESNPLVIKIKQ